MMNKGREKPRCGEYELACTNGVVYVCGGTVRVNFKELIIGGMGMLPATPPKWCPQLEKNKGRT